MGFISLKEKGRPKQYVISGPAFKKQLKYKGWMQVKQRGEEEFLEGDIIKDIVGDNALTIPTALLLPAGSTVTVRKG